MAIMKVVSLRLRATRLKLQFEQIEKPASVLHGIRAHFCLKNL